MKKIFWMIALFLFFSSVVQAGQITNPKGGWRLNRCRVPEFMQEVNYPASSLNTNENQCPDNLISGSFSKKDGEEIQSNLDETEKYSDPGLLVVNGTSMPFSMNGDMFERQYAFGIGSQSVEVRSSDGKIIRTQFYESNTQTVKPDLRIILSWDTDGTDLDLHLVTPDGEHCYYGNNRLLNGGGLDIDVTTGYGPEIFATPYAQSGVYGIYVNYYGSGNEGELTVAKVDMILHESTPDEKRVSRTIPLRREGELVQVAQFVLP